VLKPTGSIYLHCDPTASHYLKILMDAVFGPVSFRNEIIWKRTTTHSDAKRWSPITDTILFYSRSDSFTWHPQHAAHDPEYVRKKYRYDDHDGRGAYRLDNMASPNPRPNMMYEWKGFASPPKGWRYSKETMARLDAEGRIWYPDSTAKRPQVKRYLNEMPGTLLGNAWTDISPINSQAQERLGYPTQKPEALLERIVLASSNEDDLVLDPFCGCGTAIVVAQRLNRRWIGIDITHLAITLLKHRLKDTFGDSVAYEIIGEPVSLPDAATLAKQDPYQFQWWALGLVGARPVEQKKGSDRGIDGRLYFHDEGEGGQTKQVILSVKAGHTTTAHLRDLRGVVDREQAEIGVLITMQEPTQPMRSEAATAGFYHSLGWNQDYPRLQILTVAELLEGKGIDMPPLWQVSTTFKKAPKARRKRGHNLLLPMD
jgi:site-specific DNA-methyltransferase (adenine-specific)